MILKNDFTRQQGNSVANSIMPWYKNSKVDAPRWLWDLLPVISILEGLGEGGEGDGGLVEGGSVLAERWAYHSGSPAPHDLPPKQRADKGEETIEGDESIAS